LTERYSKYCITVLLLVVALMCSIRVFATPFNDNEGGFPDELFHVGRSLQNTIRISELINFGYVDDSVDDLAGFSSRVETVCELGIEKPDICPGYFESRVNNVYPVSSGNIRGRGVYIYHGLMQLVLHNVNVGFRIYFARMMAVMVGVLMVYVIYRLSFLLFHDQRLAVAVAASIGLMPSVSNIVSAVSTEGPALLAVALLLLSTTIIVVQGFSIARLLLFGFSVLCCLFTKITAIIPLPILMLFFLDRVGFSWKKLLAVFCFLIVIATTFLRSDTTKAGVAHWYFERNPGLVSVHGTPVKLAYQAFYKEYGVEKNIKPNAIANDWAIGYTCLSEFDDSSCNAYRSQFSNTIVQFLPTRESKRLSGKTVTFGSWVYANDGDIVNSPAIVLGYDNVNKDVVGGSQHTGNGAWEFVVNHIQLPNDIRDIGVSLDAADQSLVFWDDIVLIEGLVGAEGGLPVFDNRDSSSGVWNGIRFSNLLKNGSAEQHWNNAPDSFWSFMINYGTGTWANRLNGQLFTLYDLDRTGLGYFAGIRAMFVTFWGSFVGGDWPGLARWHYVVAIVFLIISLYGWLRYVNFDSTLKVIPLGLPLCFWCLVLAYLITGILRMEISAEWVPPLYYSTSRFILPAIIPVMLLLISGLVFLTSRKLSRLLIATLVLLIFLANSWMLLRVELPYFKCDIEPRWVCTDL